MGAAHVHVTRSDANTMTWGEWRQWPRAHSKETHYSATDPEARLARQGKGREAKLSLSGNVPMQNRNGLVVPPWLPRQPADHVNGVTGPKVVGEIVDILDQLAREGARLMLERALSAEVNEFLGRQRYMPAAMSFAVTASATAVPARWGSGPGRCR